MKEIRCSNLKCKYMDDNYKCVCKDINLVLNTVNTVNQGRKDYLECKSFEVSEEYERLKNIIDKTLIQGMPPITE